MKSISESNVVDGVYFSFYFTSLANYSDKSFLIGFGFTNKRGELKESDGYYIPKSQCRSVDFEKKIIELSGWWYSLNGFAWRYRVDRAPHKPDCLLFLHDVESFDPKDIRYGVNPFPCLYDIKIVGIESVLLDLKQNGGRKEYPLK